jgi:hypothetical protein
MNDIEILKLRIKILKKIIRKQQLELEHYSASSGIYQNASTVVSHPHSTVASEDPSVSVSDCDVVGCKS